LAFSYRNTPATLFWLHISFASDQHISYDIRLSQSVSIFVNLSLKLYLILYIVLFDYFKQNKGITQTVSQLLLHSGKNPK
jgi:hypothetical protein